MSGSPPSRGTWTAGQSPVRRAPGLSREQGYIPHGREGRDRPVFIVGCPRSGTTLLYHMLVSSGGFVDYRAETHFYDMVLPYFAPFSSPKNLHRFLDRWLRSAAFERFGLDADLVRSNVASRAANGGQFLDGVFSLAAQQQGKRRWAESTPLHLLYMEQIHRELPQALFVHVIRDGRDVALSLRKLGWAKPLPWDRRMKLLTAAWSWEWLVTRGRALGSRLGTDYQEVRFEELVTRPHETLEALSGFLGSSLEYETILNNAVGSVARPNTSFRSDGQPSRGEFAPVGRWKAMCSEEELASLHTTVGSTLNRLGYASAPGSSPAQSKISLHVRKLAYRSWTSTRHWVKRNTGLARLLSRPDLSQV
jgi:hypothetical protein